jgi:CPA1 family monovalent cation:H+ antiporter
MHRELFLFVTYVVVVFSILGQGLTVEMLVKKLYKTKPAP